MTQTQQANRSKQQQAQHERLSVDFADTPRAREAKHRWDCYPELLAALKHIDEYATHQCAINTDEALLWAQCRSFARAAIAKACKD